MNLKKKIISELNEVYQNNKNNINDIWMYGSFKDQISDIDLIIVYKYLPNKIIFSNLINSLLFGGSIIYIPERKKADIFLFENLMVFSIKKKRKINYEINKKYKKYRLLTSFVERYYERRLLFKKIKKKITDENLRDIKSILFSYENFYNLSKIYNFRINKINLFNKYFDIRKKFLKKKNKKEISNYIKKLVVYDNYFHKETINIIDNIFLKKNETNFEFKFTKRINFKYNMNKINDVHFFLGQLYNFYASQTSVLSKKIRSDFKSNKKLYDFDNDLQNYLLKKLNFLNIAYIDLLKRNFKNGLYRLSWYL